MNQSEPREIQDNPFSIQKNRDSYLIVHLSLSESNFIYACETGKAVFCARITRLRRTRKRTGLTHGSIELFHVSLTSPLAIKNRQWIFVKLTTPLMAPCQLAVPRHALRHLSIRRDLSSIVITNEARTGFATEKVLLRGTL